tara:strand:+ start:116 stop:472 length:357 start_codon:yes stop_codon:yes gene_type:complete
MSKLLFAWILIFLASINSTIGNLFLKKSREVENLSFFDSLYNFWFVGGLIFYAINVLFFVKALEYLPVSIAYPALAGLGFLFLSISANLIFGEIFNFVQFIGIILIFIGIALLFLWTK